MASSLFKSIENRGNTVVRENTNDDSHVRRFNTSVDDLIFINNLMEIAGKKNYVNPAIYSSNPLKFDGEDYHLFTNGYYVFANKFTDYGFTEADNPYHLEVVFQPFESRTTDSDDFIKLQLDWDSAARQEAKNKEDKENHGYKIKISDDLFCGFNPRYLLDCIQYFKAMSCLIRKDGFTEEGTLDSPVFFENKHEGKIGILCPYRVHREDFD